MHMAAQWLRLKKVVESLNPHLLQRSPDCKLHGLQAVKRKDAPEKVDQHSDKHFDQHLDAYYKEL